MTVFGNMVFADVIKLNEVIRVGSNAMTGVLTKKGKGECRDRHAQREDGFMTKEAEIGAIQLQECQGFPALPEARRS